MRACCACRIARSSRPAVMRRPEASTSVSLSTQSPAWAPVGGALSPRERMRRVRARAREQRRADEEPDERRQDDETACGVDAGDELVLEVPDDDVAPRARRRREAGGESVPVIRGADREL